MKNASPVADCVETYLSVMADETAPSSHAVAAPHAVSSDVLLAAIIDSSDDAIVSKDLNGIVTSWNKGAERIFGYAAQEIIGQSILTLIPEDRRHEENLILYRLRRGERVDHFDSVRLRKDGSEVHVSLTISPIRDQSGTIVGASKIARDVSDRKHAEQALQAQKAALEIATESALKASAEAERQGRLKDEFLATLSHELRTPLQSILGWTQLLLNDKFDEDEARRGLQIIDRNARSQVRIIEDLLDMSRILSGRVKLDMQRLPLQSVLSAAMDTIGPAAVSKGVALELDLPREDIPISGDPGRLQQVFWNIFSNAVKFTPSGGKVRGGANLRSGTVEVIIRDTGEGIDPDFLPQVFERFRQADSSKTRRHGGLGLGLAIVKNLTELHGGTVRVESEGPGKGSAFHVILPLALEVQSRAKPDAVTPEDPAKFSIQRVLTGTDVLVVDDEPDALDIVTRTLLKAGANVRSASSATSALAIFHASPPDLVVSDIGMPGMDGLALMRAIRSSPSTVPAIALSAYSRLEDRIASITAGFHMHLAKPADPADLLTIAASLVAEGKKSRSSAA